MAGIVFRAHSHAAPVGRRSLLGLAQGHARITHVCKYEGDTFLDKYLKGEGILGASKKQPCGRGVRTRSF